MQITTREYQQHTGYSNQRLNYMLKKGNYPPGIKSAKLMGRTYILTVQPDWQNIAKPVGKWERVK